MKRATLRALKKSIKHWERLCTGDDFALGADQCALCKLFHASYRKDDKPGCTGCPVFEKSGEDCCNNTPFRAVELAMALQKGACERGYVGGMAERNEMAGAVILAVRAELQFLRSLLPTVKET